MRKALALTLICLLTVIPVLRLYPLPPPVPDRQEAQLETRLLWRHDARWFGGLSGIDVTADGRRYVAVMDRGHMIEGRLIRDAGRLTRLTIDRDTAILDDRGKAQKFPFTDAEDVALSPDGTITISFEHAHRIWAYDSFDAPAHWPGYSRAWRALGENIGLESLALAPDGTLLAIPEGVLNGAYEAIVFVKPPEGDWSQRFTLPLDLPFRPVGADIGPDGRFYLLERDFRYGGFRSQVRRFDLSPDGFSNEMTLLETDLWRFGNLEGIAVWRDEAGQIRLTLVSDDNFFPLLRTVVLEFVLEKELDAPRQ